MVQKSYLYKTLRYGLIFIVVVMPFHALLTTWLGSNFGNLLAIRAWKEVLLLVLTSIGLYYYITDARLRAVIWGRVVNKLILAYGFWLLFIVLISIKDYGAIAQGLAIDIRFLVAFVLMQIVLHYQPISKKTLLKIVLLPSVGVVIFGKLQVFILPKNFLEWFGYNKQKTIPPYFTIDEQQNKLRYASTLSGPNTLGAYLVLPFTLAISRWGEVKDSTKKILINLVYSITTLMVLYSSHSRSAWLAAVISVGLLVLFNAPKKYRYFLITLGLIFALIAPLAVYNSRTSQFVEDIILHDNPVEGGEISSNLGHIAALKSGLSEVRNQPLFGCGVGCAGPASVRHNGGAKISENYFLQVAEETGVIGLSLLVGIMILVGAELYKKRNENFALVMFTTLIGLSVCNLLLHTWADDSLAYIWWVSASIVLYSKFSDTKRNQTKG